MISHSHLSGVLCPAGVSEGDPELSHGLNDGDHGLDRVGEDDGAISLAFFGGVALLVDDFHLKGGRMRMKVGELTRNNTNIKRTNIKRAHAKRTH